MAYRDLLVWQYKGSERAVATIDLFDAETQETWRGFTDLPTTYDIDYATGVSLDVIGRIVGVSRTLADATPRSFFGFNGTPTETRLSEPIRRRFHARTETRREMVSRGRRDLRQLACER